MPKILSGSSWVTKYPNSSDTADLTEPFRANVKKFIAALQAAGATVSIDTTLRSKERAYLMHWAYRIAKEGDDPTKVTELAGVDIEWVHRDSKGNTDLNASKLSAQQMVTAYGIVFKPALTSRHTEGDAIDMTITWTTPELKIKDGSNTDVVIKTGAKNGSNPELHKVGKSYSVIKLVSDPPHWSNDGH
jgi:hypothetical protein